MPTTLEVNNYIALLYNPVCKASEQTGLSWLLMLAQAALETNWGTQMFANTNNVFNIKKGKDWTGPVHVVPGATEYNKDGSKYYQYSEFRVYASLEESVLDRCNFLKVNKRYAAMFLPGTLGSLEKEAAVLEKAGYSTEPGYAQELINTAHCMMMQRALIFIKGSYP